MDKLTESLIKHLCPNRDKIRKLAYKDSKTITAKRSKTIMGLNI